MARRVIWTRKAIEERKIILSYWVHRTKSKAYSLKLNNLFIENIKILAEQPFIGRKTDEEDIRIRVVRNYLVFYEIRPTQIIILTIWDSRRNPQKIHLE